MQDNTPPARNTPSRSSDQRSQPPATSGTSRLSSRTLNGYVIPPVYMGPPRRVEPGQSAKKVQGGIAPSSDRKSLSNPSKRIQPRSAIRSETAGSPAGARSRVRFDQPRTTNRLGRSSFPLPTNLPTPSRISSQSSNMRRHSLNPAPTQAEAAPRPKGKSTAELKPLWQQLDNEHEEAVLRHNKRDRDGFSRRIGQRAIGATKTVPQDVDMRDANHDVAQIAPVLRLRVNGVTEDPDENEDEPRYRPQPRIAAQPARKSVPPEKAARKVEYWNTSSSSSEDDDDDDDDDDSSNSSSELPAPASPKSDSDVEMDEIAGDVDDAPEIILLDAPQRYSMPPKVDSERLEPPNELLHAVEGLSLSIIRMQKSRQLPFLARNIRQGFLNRCSQLQIPIFTDGRKPFLSVVYEHVTGARYQTRIVAWNCPLCNLLGNIKTREMLDCHLKWDHADVFCEWQQGAQTEKTESWELRVLIPEMSSEAAEASPVATRTPPSSNEPLTAQLTPHTRRLISPFPSVSLSPPTPRPNVTPRSPTFPKIEVKEPDPDTETPSFTPSVSSFDLSSRSRGRSTTGTTDTGTGASTRTSGASVASSSTTTRPLRASTGGNITPPPPEMPLGAATQPPYLPAKSDYGGPTVHYSCRPNGPSLVDLLGTLPMEPFGVLDWDIIDREEEIYESDAVRDEYKVIQALWMRWIMLNRNKFITDYYKGAISFVDEYWKIIHRAAGWDALRYWLFILLGNRFLDCHDMAQVLRHYEGLTGMDKWYE